MEGYTGDFCLESFHPAIVAYLRKHAPGMLRGQLSSGKLETNPITAFLLRHLLVNAVSRPHFIAYDHSSDSTLSLRLNRLLFKPFLVAWTVRSQADLDAARNRYDAVMFEGFTPRRQPVKQFPRKAVFPCSFVLCSADQAAIVRIYPQSAAVC